MGVIITDKTATAMWQKLVHNASEVCHQDLDEELESYLVFLLMRHLGDTSLATQAIAPSYLQGMQAQGQSGLNQLQAVADQCLLFSGLYPLRSRRRLVKAQYYVDMGRSAYLQIAERVKQVYVELYENLSRHFVEMMDILQALRCSKQHAELDSLLLLENWHESQSQFARQLLEQRFEQASLHAPHPKKQ